MPNEAYTSEFFYRLECERLFPRTWMLAGLLRDFSAPSTVYPLTLAGIPIILVTDAEGTIRGFQNVCRHRGARLVSEPRGQVKALTCPYHHWSYSLTGSLLSRPHYYGSNQHDAPPRSDDAPGLIPVRVGVWYHWVFVNIDGGAGSLTEHVAFAESLLSGYRMDGLTLLRTLDFDVSANWKLVLENFWEPNHSFVIHPQLMGAGPSEKRSAVRWKGSVIHGVIDFDEDVDSSLVPGGAMPYQDGDRSTVNRAVWLMLFPNMCISFWPGNLGVFEVIPQAPERSVVRLHIYVAEETLGAPEHERGRRDVLSMWADTCRQDMEAVEWMQAGRHCPGFDGGALSPYWDGAVSAFAEWVREAVSNAGVGRDSASAPRNRR